MSADDRRREKWKTILSCYYKTCSYCNIVFGGLLEGLNHFRVRHKLERCPVCLEIVIFNDKGNEFEEHLKKFHLTKNGMNKKDNQIACTFCGEWHHHQTLWKHMSEKHLEPILSNSTKISPPASTKSISSATKSNMGFPKQLSSESLVQNDTSSISSVRISSPTKKEDTLVIGKCVQRFTDQQQKAMIPIFLKNPNRPWADRAKEVATVLNIDHNRVASWLSNCRRRFRDKKFPNWAVNSNGFPLYTISYSPDGRMKITSIATNCGKENCSETHNVRGPEKRRHFEMEYGLPNKMKCYLTETESNKYFKKSIKKVACEEEENGNINEKMKSLKEEVILYKAVIQRLLKDDPTPPAIRHNISEPEDRQSASIHQHEKCTPVQQSETRSNRYKNSVANQSRFHNHDLESPKFPLQTLNNNSETRSVNDSFGKEMVCWERRYRTQNGKDESHVRTQNWKGNRRVSGNLETMTHREIGPNFSNRNEPRRDQYDGGSKRNFYHRRHSESYPSPGFERRSPKSSRRNENKNESIRSDRKRSFNYVRNPFEQKHLNQRLENETIQSFQKSNYTPSTNRRNENRRRQAETSIINQMDIKRLFKESKRNMDKLMKHYYGRYEDYKTLVDQTKLLSFLIDHQIAFENDQLQYIRECLEEENRYDNRYNQKKTFKMYIAQYWVPILIYAKNFKIHVEEAVKDFMEASNAVNSTNSPCLESIKKMFM